MRIINGLILLGIGFLAVAGCSIMQPVRGIVNTELTDPFLTAVDNTPENAVTFGTLDSENLEPVAEKLPVNEELLVEDEDKSITSETEQVELLNQDLWVKNLALIRFQETGKKPEVSVSSEDRQRRDSINRLNMSSKELAKKKNQHYEYVNGTESDWRWMHRGVDKLLAIQPEQRICPDVFLKEAKYKGQKNRLLRANAAILLGRDGNTAVSKYLLQLLETNTLPISLRCAAAETLGRLQNITEKDLLPLLQNATESAAATKTPQQALPNELWEELLVAMAVKINPWDNAVFIEPFAATSFDVRFAAAKIWRIKSLERTSTGVNDRLPEAFLEFAKREGNPQIRLEIIKTLGAWREPNLYQILSADLNRSAEVRNAAMSALAESDCQEAVPAIKNKLHDTSGVNRAAAVAALRKLGCIDEVLKQSKDEDQRVRSEVAKALAEKCNSQTAILAKKYIEDRYEPVQAATIAAVAGWDIAESGQVFLTAAKSPYQKIRCRATALLAKHGIEYEQFNPEDTPKNQAANYQELVQIYSDVIGISVDLTAVDLAAALVPQENKTATRSSTSLAPFITKLETGTVQEQRQAVTELAKQCSVEPPAKDDAKRILDIIVRQSDPAILTTLLSTLQDADPVLVGQAARNMLQAEQPEIRRLSCELLKRFGMSDDLMLLDGTLRDPSKAVVRGALQAIDALLPKAEASSKTAVMGTLKKMLYQNDPMLQTDVAVTLHRLGSNEGTEAIRRLAAAKDNRVKCYVAKSIAGLQDERFVPILLGYLDDGNGSVRNEALKALPILTGKDIANDAGSHTAEVSQTQRQVSLWKTWAASRTSR